MKRFFDWLHRQKKETVVTIATLLVIVIAGAAVLLNASRLQNIFDPEKFARFGNSQEGENYDSVAGDGQESDLADRDRDGNSREDVNEQKAVKLEGPKPQDLVKSDDDEGIGRTTGDAVTSGNPDRNPDAYETADQGNSRLDNADTAGSDTGNAGTVNSGTENDGTKNHDTENNDTGSNNSGNNDSENGGTGNGDTENGGTQNSDTGNSDTENGGTGNGETGTDDTGNGNGNSENNDGGNGGSTEKDPGTQGGNESDTPPSPGPKPDTDPALSESEQSQLKPRDPIITENGELLSLSAVVNADQERIFYLGDAFDREWVTVTAVFRQNDGSLKEQVLDYGGTAGYSVSFPTLKPGHHTAIFRYRGLTATVDYEVLDSRARIYYYAYVESEKKAYMSAGFPGLVEQLVDAENAKQLDKIKEMGKDSENIYASAGSVIDLTEYHQWLIAYLGDEKVEKVFKDSGSKDYSSVNFLEKYENSYLKTMLGGFRDFSSSASQPDVSRGYLYYPVSKDWGALPHKLADVVVKVPDDCKIRIDTSGSTADLPSYKGDQVLEQYLGKDQTLNVPLGVTKIDFRGTEPNNRVQELCIPESVSGIDTKSVADYLPNLSAYSLDSATSVRKGLKVKDGVLYSADGKTLLSVPPGMENMPDWANGVTTIASDAFAGSQITELKIPETVVHFEKRLF